MLSKRINRFFLAAVALSFTCYAWAAPKLSERWNSVDSSGWTDEYDEYFRKYSKRYFGPHFDWRWFKAQAIAESGLDPQIESSAGAIGLMQILPTTFAEIRDANPHYVDILTPRWNIAAGIYYDHYLYRRWSELPEEERLYLAFASYNAGLGGARRAYRRAEQPVNTWSDVAPHAPNETQGYVSRIKRLYTSQQNEPIASPRLRGLSRYLLGNDS